MDRKTLEKQIEQLKEDASLDTKYLADEYENLLKYDPDACLICFVFDIENEDFLSGKDG